MKLSIEHQGRELVHAIGLLNRCLQIPNCSASMRAGWEQNILKARQDLEALHVGGLHRSFLSQVARPPTRQVQRGPLSYGKRII
jgi:hypothetical protein